MHIIKKSDFADECGLDRSTISHALRGQLAPALVGKRIDAAHPAAIAFAAKKHGLRGNRSTPPDYVKRSTNDQIGDYVVRRADELRDLSEALTPHSVDVAATVEEISLQLFVIGFEAKRMGSVERETRVTYVENALGWLRTVATPTL